MPRTDKASATGASEAITVEQTEQILVMSNRLYNLYQALITPLMNLIIVPVTLSGSFQMLSFMMHRISQAETDALTMVFLVSTRHGTLNVTEILKGTGHLNDIPLTEEAKRQYQLGLPLMQRILYVFFSLVVVNWVLSRVIASTLKRLMRSANLTLLQDRRISQLTDGQTNKLSSEDGGDIIEGLRKRSNRVANLEKSVHYFFYILMLAEFVYLSTRQKSENSKALGIIQPLFLSGLFMLLVRGLSTLIGTLYRCFRPVPSGLEILRSIMRNTAEGCQVPKQEAPANQLTIDFSRVRNANNISSKQYCKIVSSVISQFRVDHVLSGQKIIILSDNLPRDKAMAQRMNRSIIKNIAAYRTHQERHHKLAKALTQMELLPFYFSYELTHRVDYLTSRYCYNFIIKVRGTINHEKRSDLQKLFCAKNLTLEAGLDLEKDEIILKLSDVDADKIDFNKIKRFFTDYFPWLKQERTSQEYQQQPRHTPKGKKEGKSKQVPEGRGSKNTVSSAPLPDEWRRLNAQPVEGASIAYGRFFSCITARPEEFSDQMEAKHFRKMRMAMRRAKTQQGMVRLKRPRWVTVTSKDKTENVELRWKLKDPTKKTRVYGYEEQSKDGRVLINFFYADKTHDESRMDVRIVHACR